MSPGPVTRSALKRHRAVRKRKRAQMSHVNPLEKNVVVPPMKPLRKPTSPHQVLVHEKQDLSLALKRNNPLSAEAVDMQHEGPLYLGHALEDSSVEVGAREEHTVEKQEDMPYLRPNRCLNYRTFYNSSRRQKGDKRRWVAE